MWWRLSLPVQPELEESLLWKLNALGLHRVAQHAPETPDQRTLLAWLPAHEWPEDQRHELLGSLAPLADTFGLALAAPRWDELADEDWSRSWKQHWQPDPVGRGMLILPAWLEVLEEHAGRLVLKMDLVVPSGQAAVIPPPGSASKRWRRPRLQVCGWLIWVAAAVCWDWPPWGWVPVKCWLPTRTPWRCERRPITLRSMLWPPTP